MENNHGHGALTMLRSQWLDVWSCWRPGCSDDIYIYMYFSLVKSKRARVNGGRTFGCGCGFGATDSVRVLYPGVESGAAGQSRTGARCTVLVRARSVRPVPPVRRDTGARQVVAHVRTATPLPIRRWCAGRRSSRIRENVRCLRARDNREPRAGPITFWSHGRRAYTRRPQPITRL